MRSRVDQTLSSQSSDSLSRHPERKGPRTLRWSRLSSLCVSKEMVHRTGFVEASVINAHSPFLGLLFNKNRIGKPVRVVYLFDESGYQEFGDLLAYGPAPLVIKATQALLDGL